MPPSMRCECHTGNETRECVCVFITAGSALQTLTLNIRHEARDTPKHFRRGFQTASSLYGSIFHFGVGMLFVPSANYESYYGGTSANNVVIFNSFSIVENTFEALTIVKESAYILATHVAFWTRAERFRTGSREHHRFCQRQHSLQHCCEYAIDHGS
jgi:hypothetical protein